MSRHVWVIIFVGAVLIVGYFIFVVGRLAIEILGIGHPVRYREVAKTEWIDAGQRLISTFYSDCSGEIIKGGLTPGTHIKRRGDDAHFVLHDRSILVIPKLVTCRWATPMPPVDTTVRLDPTLGDRQAPPAGTVRVYPEASWLFNNPENPTVAKIYDTRALFSLGADAIQIRSTDITRIDRWSGGWIVPRTLDSAFPWLSKVPRGETPDGLNGYFHGFRAEVRRVVGSECGQLPLGGTGPMRLEKEPCDSLPDCDTRRVPTQCIVNVGWLVAEATPDFSSVSFSLARSSVVQQATLYRESNILAERGPGRVGYHSFYWQPRVCLDGFCMDLTQVKNSIAYLFYYPEQHALVRVVSVRENAAGRFHDGHRYYYD